MIGASFRSVRRCAIAAAAATAALILALAPIASAATFGETTGGSAATWSNYSSGGGTAGSVIPDGTTVQISCVVQGLKVADGNQNWYRVSSPPWSDQFYVSADAFYNNGATSGSLKGTPWVDPAVPNCASLGTGSQSGSQTQSLPNAFYNRTAAVQWALANAENTQHYGTECTWFVSQALFAGGFPKSSAWTNTGSFGYDGILSLPGTRDAWLLPAFLSYFESHFSYSIINITPNFRTNAVPQAEPGDLILYDWAGQGLSGVSHVTMVTGLSSGQYPNVSEMGQYSGILNTIITKTVGIRSSYTQRGWTWSQVSHEWLQKKYPKVQAYLLHINGGYDAPSF